MATLPAGILEEEPPVETSLDHLQIIAESVGDISPAFSEEELVKLGTDVVEDYERDCTDRQAWADKVKEGLKLASQEEAQADKAYPFDKASNVQYPILTIAATEFNARAYPAIVKGDETVQVKVVGSDKGRPQMMQTPQGLIPVPQLQPNPETGAPEPVMGPDGQPQVVWAIPPGAKTARAQRVKEYLNVVINYRMADWEADTDVMLYQLPIVGCGFRKVWWAKRKGQPAAGYVPALRLVVPMDAKSLETAPRVTEEIPDVYPYLIRQRIASGEYREWDIPNDHDDAEKPRLLLEQHRLLDLDEDGIDEPYIVTVDKETRHVLKVEAAFSPDDVQKDGETVIEITRQVFYVKYDFFPHPEGKFYGIGFAHLLHSLGSIINTTINQMFDAGHAQIAGGGFIASGLRLQGSNRQNTMRWRPGEYKVVTAGAGALKDAIYERTTPQPSAIMFNLLELILGAAKDVAAIKDVTSGDASNNGQVGTTLALIEQGLQVFTAIYKRIYRGLKSEFQRIFELEGRYGDEKTAQDYIDVLDDPLADFAADFNAADMDIRPVSDPNSVTRLQKMARAQFLQQTGTGNPNVNQHELMRRVYEAADIEDLDKLVPPPSNEPNPAQVAELEKVASETNRNNAQADYYRAQSAEKGVETGLKLGEADGGAGRIPGMAGAPDNQMGLPGSGEGGIGTGGGMEPAELGAGAG